MNYTAALSSLLVGAELESLKTLVPGGLGFMVQLKVLKKAINSLRGGYRIRTVGIRWKDRRFS